MVVNASWFLNYSYMFITYQVVHYKKNHFKIFVIIDQMYENLFQNYRNKQYGIINTLL